MQEKAKALLKRLEGLAGREGHLQIVSDENVLPPLSVVTWTDLPDPGHTTAVVLTAHEMGDRAFDAAVVVVPVSAKLEEPTDGRGLRPRIKARPEREMGHGHRGVGFGDQGALCNARDHADLQGDRRHLPRL